MLEGKTVAILVAEGFEQSEMVKPRKALQVAGAETLLVSPAEGEVQGSRGRPRQSLEPQAGRPPGV